MNIDSADAVVARIGALVLARPRQTVWIGIDGFGGSGKTTLARWLAATIPGAQSVSVDDFAGPGLDTWDFERFAREVAEPLNRGEPARYARRGWAPDAAGTLTISAGRPVIVEGVSATDRRVAVDWDLTVWVHTDPAERRRRIGLRDDAETLSRWESDWWPSEEAYAARQHPVERADFIVSGELPRP